MLPNVQRVLQPCAITIAHNDAVRDHIRSSKVSYLSPLSEIANLRDILPLFIRYHGKSTLQIRELRLNLGTLRANGLLLLSFASFPRIVNPL